jgi:thiol-disulfide isomerase/thioredoxin
MRLLTLGLVIFFAAGAIPFSRAAELPYTPTSFDAAVKEGRPVAVVFHADWCPTCRAQAPVLKELMLEPRYKDLTLFVADYDKEKALERSLRVTQQSTIVVFKGGAEVTRSTGDTTRDTLAALLAKAGTGA